jgi:hypothetical protein
MPQARWPDDPVPPGAAAARCYPSAREPLACAGYARVSPSQNPKWRWDGISVSPNASLLDWSYWKTQSPQNATLRINGFFA